MSLGPAAVKFAVLWLGAHQGRLREVLCVQTAGAALPAGGLAHLLQCSSVMLPDV